MRNTRIQNFLQSFNFELTSIKVFIIFFDFIVLVPVILPLQLLHKQLLLKPSFQKPESLPLSL